MSNELRFALRSLLKSPGFSLASVLPLALGVAIGVAGAIAAGRAISTQLFEVTPYDPLILGSAAVLLGAAAALACWLPAKKATRVNPVEALRTE